MVMNSIRDLWDAFVKGGALNGQPRPLIRDSGRRSRSAAVEPRGAAPRRVEDAELTQRLKLNAELIAAARPHLEWLAAALGPESITACLTDADGIVLLALGADREPGEDWSERTAGTNGAGLALVAGEPVAIVGAEHFAERLHDRASVAAPIRVAGVVAGAIDAVMQRATGGGNRTLLVEHVALSIGRELARRPIPPAAPGTITDLVPVFIASCDRQRRLKYANRGFAERFGRTPEDVTGQPIAEVAGSEAFAAFAPHIELVLAGQAVEFEVEVPFEHGGPRFLHCAFAPERGTAGDVVGWIAVLTDMTEWKRTEERLGEAFRDLERRVEERTAEVTEANEFLQALLASIEDGIIVCNSVGELTLFNAVTERVNGLPLDSVPAHHWARIFGLYRADGITPLHAEEVPLYRALLGERVQNVELMIVPPDGPARAVLANARPFHDGAGNLLGAVMSMNDITTRQQAEEALRTAHEVLERRVRERTAELAEANEALRRADRAKDDFLAMLAHELRNPLAPIRNALHILNQAGADPATLDKVRGMAGRQVAHMARLLEDLLDMARIRQGRVELRHQPVDVAELLARTADAVRPQAEERRHEFTTSPPPAPLRVHGDITRLEQVLVNLLNNACKYTDPGGHLHLSAERDGAEAVIRVRDDGIGIAPEMLGRVFDMFVQVERRLDRAQGGVGIGLTLVKKLVELHGGSVEVRSEGVGRGSEFAVRLPVLADTTAAPARKKAESWPTIGLPDRRVLVVDDNEDAADSLAILLRLAGQNVRAAYDGPTALRLAEEFRPDLALIDIGMPGMDGHEVARKLRATFAPDRLTLIALTGWGHEDDRRRSREAGFDHHLVKPVEPNVLKQLLTDWNP
jgi:PAS domain S-box-containing protein